VLAAEQISRRTQWSGAAGAGLEGILVFEEDTPAHASCDNRRTVVFNAQ